MKFIASGFAALVLGSSAMAQTSVTQVPLTIYGVVDLGIEMTSGSASVTRMGFGTEASKWGIRGGEDLGGGLRTTFQLEGGFSADTGVGSNGGRMWGRTSTVGLAGPWGEVKFGRHTTMLNLSMIPSDSFGPAWYGMGTLDSYLPNARVDNAIIYMGRFGGFDIGATYSLGRDVVKVGPTGAPSGTNCSGEAADSSACREVSFMLRYATKGWGLAYGMDELSGGVDAFGGLTSSDLKDRRSTLSGFVMLSDKVRLSGGILKRVNDGSATERTSKIHYLNGKYDLNESTSVDAEALRLNFDQTSKSANYYIVRASHKLSKRTSVYATAARIENSANSRLTVSPGLPSTLGMGQNGVILGMKHAF